MYFNDFVTFLFTECGPFVDLSFLLEKLVSYFEMVNFAFWVPLLVISFFLVFFITLCYFFLHVVIIFALGEASAIMFCSYTSFHQCFICCMSCCWMWHILPSLCAICSVLLSIFIKLSASPLALGCSGVILWWWNPISLAYSANSTDWNGGPLSDSSISGISFVANIFLSLSQVTRQEVDVVCSTTGNLVLLSITTRL